MQQLLTNWDVWSLRSISSLRKLYLFIREKKFIFALYICFIYYFTEFLSLNLQALTQISCKVSYFKESVEKWRRKFLSILIVKLGLLFIYLPFCNLRLFLRGEKFSSQPGKQLLKWIKYWFFSFIFSKKLIKYLLLDFSFGDILKKISILIGWNRNLVSNFEAVTVGFSNIDLCFIFSRVTNKALILFITENFLSS